MGVDPHSIFVLTLNMSALLFVVLILYQSVECVHDTLVDELHSPVWGLPHSLGY